MTLLAAGVCGLVAWRTGRIGPTILSGIASVWLGRLVWGGVTAAYSPAVPVGSSAGVRMAP